MQKVKVICDQDREFEVDLEKGAEVNLCLYCPHRHMCKEYASPDSFE